MIFRYKNSERWAQYQTKSLILSVGITEPHPILYKNSERWAQYQTKSLILSAGIAEPHPILYKNSERWAHSQVEDAVFNLTMPIRLLSDTNTKAL